MTVAIPTPKAMTPQNISRNCQVSPLGHSHSWGEFSILDSKLLSQYLSPFQGDILVPKLLPLPVGAHGPPGPGASESVGTRPAGGGGAPLSQPDLGDRGWPGCFRVHPDGQACVQTPAPRWVAGTDAGRAGRGLEASHASLLSSSARKHLHRLPRSEACQREGEISF